MLYSRPFQFAGLLLGSFFASGMLVAQTTESTAYFQDAATVTSTNAISVTRLPVTIGATTKYWDINLPLTVDVSGNVTLGAFTSIPSPALVTLTSSFIPGTYVGPPTILGGQALIVLSGPGVFNGKDTAWTITSASGASPQTYPESGNFYVVDKLTSNPIYPRLKAANISSTAASYGTGTSIVSNAWPPNGIIGVSQVGNTLTIESFTYEGTDSDVPYDQITYTLVQP